MNWEENRRDEIKTLTQKGILPVAHDADMHGDDEEIMDNLHPFLMGIVAGVINERKTAKDIVDEIVDGAAERIKKGNAYLTAKL